MYKVLVLTVAAFCLVQANSDALLQKHLGANSIVALFPSHQVSACSTQTLIRQDFSRCTCPEVSGTVPQVKSTINGVIEYFPVISVDNYSAVVSRLNQVCDCGSAGQKQPSVLWHLDDIYAVLYQNNIGSLLAKNLPSLAELQALLAGEDQLADMQILCTN